MFITKISYRRTFNLGNYESETIELSADIEIDESVDDAMEKLKVKAHAFSATTEILVEEHMIYEV